MALNITTGITYTVSDSAPSAPSKGDMWFDTVNNYLKVYNGTSWEGMNTFV